MQLKLYFIISKCDSLVQKEKKNIEAFLILRHYLSAGEYR